MVGAHILNGDTVVLELKPAHDGAVVAALVDGESTLKRCFVRRGAPYPPPRRSDWPDRDLLARRFELFKKAN